MYHQPAAGGTTVAKQVLWELKNQYRCVVVKHITENTCNQLLDLRSHNDPHPKPVLLLLDNFGDEQISDLLEKVVKEARMLNSGRLTSVAFVVFVCSRKANLMRSNDANTFVLESKLSCAELLWMSDKYKLLEHNHKDKKNVDPKNFISFNILKTNFNQEYIKKSVKELIMKITLPQERNLLMYISLINRFDESVTSLPVASFDCIMGKAKWEMDISQPLRVLLNETVAGHMPRPCQS